MQENNEQKIVFPDNTSGIISDILRKHGIKDTDQEIEDKLFGENNEPLKEEAILNSAIEVINGKTQKENLATLLQKELKVPLPTAEDIAKVIEEKIINLSKRVSAEEWAKGRLKDTIYKEESDESLNAKIIFELPETTIIEKIINEILKDNNLEESSDEASRKSTQGGESRAIILKDNISVVLQKKIPDEKLVEFLVKHLEISEEVAMKIIRAIHEKIITFAKITNANEENSVYDKEKYKEALLNKIRGNKSTAGANKEASAMPYKKNPSITDVEDNAEAMQKENKLIIPNSEKLAPQQKQEKQPDPYKEAIE